MRQKQQENEDLFFMKQALIQAKAAADKGEVPIGAVVVCQGKVIARAHNLTQTLNDVTAHAEMQVITAAENTIDGKYLPNCTLYVTLEPCVMCAAAMAWAHVGKLVFGAQDDKCGYQRLSQRILHPKTEIKQGVLQEECSELIKQFFEDKR